ncbi:MAG TPA: phenylacetate--CoA ligase [Spirochaetota bacterium]|nr:phenylacetate--CoA ligase [Spirochaetota bacterium]
MFYNNEIETLPRKELEKLQMTRLKKALEAAASTPYYRKLYSDMGINVSKITTFDHLQELPFTTKNDLRMSYPTGMVAVPISETVRMHASSGTTGKSTVIFYTRRDVDQWAEQVARAMYSTGARKEDILQNMMGYGLFTGGLGLHYGAEKLGCLVIPSAAGNSLRQIQLMQDFHPTIIHITPSYALHLVEVIKGQGIDPHSLGIKKAYFGAEPYSEATKDKLEQLWGVKAYNCYGLSEMNGPGVAFECAQQAGMHLAEDYYITEIIDPETGERLPDGTEGELVLTHINREAMPIIRYRTRDLTRIIPEPCGCGKTHRRIERIKGRSDDMIIVGGVNVFPSQIEAVIMNIPEVGNNYQIILDREEGLDRIHIKVELYSKLFKGDLKTLQKLNREIVEKLRALIIVTPRIEFMEPGSLPPSEGKAKRVFDNRVI